MSSEDIEKLIDELGNSTLFALSSSSKELSHSNEWAMLMNNNHEYVRAFFPKINVNDIDRITREEKNRDITIWVKGKPSKAYVIENKLKSVPSRKQLEDYKNVLDAHKQFGDGVLTGVKDTLGQNLPDGWKFIGHDDIIKSFREINSKDPILNQYFKDLKAIYDIVNFETEEIGEFFPISELYKDKKGLQKVKLDDVCKKIKASQFCNYIENKTDWEELRKQAKEYEFRIKCGYNHKKTTVDVVFEKNNNFIGIQIENNQYRRCVQKNDKRLEDVFDEYCKKGWFSEYKQNRKITFSSEEYDTAMRDKYCSYRPAFVYQYWTFDKKGSAFDILLKHIEDDMRIAVKIIQETDR